ncbi:hypothetical protein ACLOJK_019082 [Asimina triloba]
MSSAEKVELKKGGGGGVEKVPFYKLFAFADPLDVGFMLAGTVGAIANGLSLPLMTIFFGDLINSFGDSNKSNVVHQVSTAFLMLDQSSFDANAWNSGLLMIFDEGIRWIFGGIVECNPTLQFCSYKISPFSLKS